MLRIIAATSVLFSHSYLIIDTVLAEPVKIDTGVILGTYGVWVFFILSGFLVSDSAIRSTTFADFGMKRVRRMAPAFLTCNLLVVLLICPPFAVNGAWAFLSDPATWAHVFRVLTLREGSLFFPDVIQFFSSTGSEKSWLPGVANGVLWTVRQEVVCYLIVALMMAGRLITQTAVLGLFALSVAGTFAWSIQTTDFLGGFCFVFPAFAAGMVLRCFAHEHTADGRIAAVSVVLLAILAVQKPHWAALAPAIFPLFATYPILWFGQQDNAFFRWSKPFGDPSYGIYLWAWPIQMAMRDLVGDSLPAPLFFLLCVPFVFLVGYASWHLIEQPFLRRARKVPTHVQSSGA
jgi:peptidoglycan/LPS O-acetylase OafA/YrhL